MALTDYMERKLNDYYCNGTALSSFTPYIGLFTAAPSDTGGGTECADSNYVRIDATGYFPADSGTDATLANDVVMEWPAFAAERIISHVGWFDASTSGNLIRYAALDAPVTVPAGAAFRFPVGDLISKPDNA